jgi:hypothetical protein
MRFVIAFLTVLLFACLATDGQAAANKQKFPLSCGKWKENFFRYVIVCVVAADGKSLSGWITTNTEKNRKRIVGKHVFRLSARVQRSAAYTYVDVDTTVEASLKEGRQYVGMGKMEDRRVFVWIEDAATKQRVSTVATFAFRDCGPLGCLLPWRRIEP